jgi:hypothetical protein
MRTISLRSSFTGYGWADIQVSSLREVGRHLKPLCDAEDY